VARGGARTIGGLADGERPIETTSALEGLWPAMRGPNRGTATAAGEPTGAVVGPDRRGATDSGDVFEAIIER
jgi:hypothetical protein